MCTTRSSRSGARLRDRSGFTMVELVVGLVITGLLTGVILQVLQANARFVSLQSSQEEVQQNSRAALDLIATELRTAPAAGLLERQPNSVRFYLPRAWGVLCNDVTSSTTTAWILFPQGVFPEDQFAYGLAQWGVAVQQTTDPSVSDTQYRFVSGVLAPSTTNPCGAIQPQMSTAQHRSAGFRTPGTPFAASGVTIPIGTPVALYEEVRYDVARPSGAADFWVRRMTGYSSGSTPNMQPMAGPVPAADALAFQFFQADGVTPATTAETTRRIRITLTTQSRTRMVKDGALTPQQSQTTTTDVFLRN